MTKKEFLNRMTGSKRDIVQELLDGLQSNDIGFCLIGGLAVNAYTDPVVSLDLDLVVVSDKVESALKAFGSEYKIERFANSIDVSHPSSDLRVQLQTDIRYQLFLPRAQALDVLGYQIPVAAVEDVLQGKIWVASDSTRRASKRQKDLADIARLVEAKPELSKLVPSELLQRIQ